MIWLLLGILLTPVAWAEDPPPPSDPQEKLESLRTTLKECEAIIRDLQDKVTGVRRRKSEDTSQALADLRQSQGEYRERCGSLSQSFESLRKERTAPRSTSRDQVELERRLMALGQAERKLDGGLRLAEVEQQRRIETERRNTEAAERQAQREEKRKEETAQRQTQANVRRLQQNHLPRIINKGKEVLDDK